MSDTKGQRCCEQGNFGELHDCAKGQPSESTREGFEKWWAIYSKSVAYHDEHYIDHELIANAGWQARGASEYERGRRDGLEKSAKDSGTAQAWGEHIGFKIGLATAAQHKYSHGRNGCQCSCGAYFNFNRAEIDWPAHIIALAATSGTPAEHNPARAPHMSQPENEALREALAFLADLSNATTYRSHDLGYEDSISIHWREDAADLHEKLASRALATTPVIHEDATNPVCDPDLVPDYDPTELELRNQRVRAESEWEGDSIAQAAAPGGKEPSGSNSPKYMQMGSITSVVDPQHRTMVAGFPPPPNIIEIPEYLDKVAKEIAEEFCGGSEAVEDAILAKLLATHPLQDKPPADCPKCGGELSEKGGHGARCPKETCKWGWETEMDGSPLLPPKGASSTSEYERGRRDRVTPKMMSEVFAQSVNATDPDHEHLYDHRIAAGLLNKMLAATSGTPAEHNPARAPHNKFASLWCDACPRPTSGTPAPQSAQEKGAPMKEKWNSPSLQKIADERDERFRRMDIRRNILKRLAELRVDTDHLDSAEYMVGRCVEIIKSEWPTAPPADETLPVEETLMDVVARLRAIPNNALNDLDDPLEEMRKIRHGDVEREMLEAAPTEAPLRKWLEGVLPAIAIRIHAYMSAAQNLPYEEGETCEECEDIARELIELDAQAPSEEPHK